MKGDVEDLSDHVELVEVRCLFTAFITIQLNPVHVCGLSEFTQFEALLHAEIVKFLTQFNLPRSAHDPTL